MGTVPVAVCFLTATLLRIIDRDTPTELLGGLLTGAMTSTPGLTALCESVPDGAGYATIGYSSSYLIGITGILLFTQLLDRRISSGTPAPGHSAVPGSNPIRLSERGTGILVFLTAVFGSALGNLTLFSSFPLGNSGGILIAEMGIGYLIARRTNLCCDKETLLKLRKTGLAVFFVGTGNSRRRTVYGFLEPEISRLRSASDTCSDHCRVPFVPSVQNPAWAGTPPFVRGAYQYTGDRCTDRERGKSCRPFGFCHRLHRSAACDDGGNQTVDMNLSGGIMKDIGKTVRYAMKRRPFCVQRVRMLTEPTDPALVVEEFVPTPELVQRAVLCPHDAKMLDCRKRRDHLISYGESVPDEPLHTCLYFTLRCNRTYRVSLLVFAHASTRIWIDGKMFSIASAMASVPFTLMLDKGIHHLCFENLRTRKEDFLSIRIHDLDLEKKHPESSVCLASLVPEEGECFLRQNDRGFPWTGSTVS